MIEPQSYEEIKKTERLPSPRGVALRLMELCRQDNASLVEIVRTLNADPALTGQVIKIANSPVYARPRPVVSLSPEVIISIGIQTLRQMVLAFSLISVYRKGDCKAFDYESFWSRSTATALAANHLGALVPVAPCAELFTCGLLCDIGRLTLASVYPDSYSDILRQCLRQSDLLNMERQAYALDHNQLTAAMMQDWGIPKLFSEAALFHESPETCEYPAASRPYNLVYVLHLATQLAKSCFLDDYQRSAELPRLFKTAEKIGVTPEQLVQLGDQMLNEWREWSGLLHLASPDAVRFSELEPQAADSAAAPDFADPAMTQGIRLLVADGDAALLMLFAKKLSSLGYQVYSAGDGNQALQLVSSHAPHVVIADATLPGINGLALCKAIRQMAAGRGIYFIILTAHKEKGHLVEAFQAGADDFMTKPIGAKTLLGRLSAGTRIVRLQQALEQEQQHQQLSDTVDTDINAALSDPLTHLPNRRYAMARLGEQWVLAEQNHVPFCCLRLKPDGYGAIAAQYPQNQQIQLLQQFADRLRDASRQADIICHLGREDFLIICPNTPIGTAAPYAGRLLSHMVQAPFQLEGASRPIDLTISIGATANSADIRNVDHLLKTCESALAEAIASGGGRVCITTKPLVGV
ncbi:MAG: HDOD domain-containing protein [Methylococcaceae bacterium]|nr:MAG: HDOD domain-containing protein [Methylococcaceae bacterium]